MACLAFQETISGIARDVVDLSVPSDLFLDERFVAIYEHPQPSLDCAIRLIDQPSLSATERGIIALALQQVGLDGYLSLADKALAGYRAGRVSLAALETVLIPPVGWGDALLLHADDPRVQHLLRAFADLDGVDEATRTYVEREVLTGRSAERRRRAGD